MRQNCDSIQAQLKEKQKNISKVLMKRFRQKFNSWLGLTGCCGFIKGETLIT